MTEHRKCPRDPNQLGKFIVDVATGEAPSDPKEGHAADGSRCTR
jgi:hypothetical protein